MRREAKYISYFFSHQPFFLPIFLNHSKRFIPLSRKAFFWIYWVCLWALRVGVTLGIACGCASGHCV
ncbi:hypothetical protein RX944_23955, partial [Pseudomonas syringae pv. actinidiae]|nr:hypothetical protein [Pseudomonas syringae pv. actinidiae]